MPDQLRFQQLQKDFCAHIREPQTYSCPQGIEDRRMAVYRELLFNNVNNFLESGFPVLRSIYNDHDWEKLTRAFFAKHRSQTPYFAKIPEEFLNFLQEEYETGKNDPPFLLELAHYEWVELALSILEDESDKAAVDPHGHLLDGIPVLSKAAWLLGYQWPVQHISSDFIPEQPLEEANHLIVYRGDDGGIGFIEANPVTARLFQYLTENQFHSGRTLLDQIAAELKHPNPEVVIDGGHQILTRLHHLGIVRGTRSTKS